MKFFLLFTLFLLMITTVSSQTINRNITIKITPLHNCTIYLGSYFGNQCIFADTAMLNEKGEGVFKGKKQLTNGMYFVVSPKNIILFELMLDSTQQFSITADTSHLNAVQISGSPENTLFKQYTTGMMPVMTELKQLNAQLKSAKNRADSVVVSTNLTACEKAIAAYKTSYIDKYPQSQLAFLLKASNNVQLPASMTFKNHADTVKAWQYIKEHYWDDVPFNDDRLLYTSFFEPKIDNYFNLYISPTADSVIKEVQYMLLYARTGKEMYPYLLTKFVNQYFNPRYIGQNKVFLYLFNAFLMRGDTSLFDARSKKLIYERAYALMANEVGDAAPPLDLTTADGKAMPLYSLQAPYTLVVFWDPSCTHCQRELPRIDSIYRAKWKTYGLKLYSVNIYGGLMNDVVTFAKDNNLSTDWIHTYQTDAAAKAIVESGKLNYLQTYNIVETPTLYLLDAQKCIIAKGLSIEQFDALMKIKNASIK